MKNYFVKIVATAIVALIAAAQLKAQGGEYLYVYSPAGASQTFSLETLRKITFTEQGMNMYPKSGSATFFQYTNIAAMTFKSKVSAMPVVKNPDLKLYWEDNTLMIENDTEITAVKLYNMQGTLLHRTAETQHATSLQIPLFSCPAGVYIVQIINNQGISTHKIIKQ